MKDIIFIGDGIGQRTFISVLLDLDVIGTDISQFAVETAKEIYPLLEGRYFQDDIINSKLKEKAKLVVVYDVLEHLEEKDLDKALENIYKLGNNNFLFSIAFQGDPNLLLDKTHKIFKPKEWWLEKLRQHKFKIEPTPKHFLFHPQITIIKK